MVKHKYKVVMVLLLIVIAALVTALMSSALLGWQHNWYEIAEEGNDVPCTKCHMNVEAEFTGMQPGAPHKSRQCEFCHRNESGVTYAIGDGPGFQPGKEAHAASIPPCQQCHIPDIRGLSSKNESHKPLNDTSGLNDACIVCHTGFDKSMDFKRARYLEYDLFFNTLSSSFEILNFSFIASNSTVINQTPSGSKHTWINASEIYCFDCHSDVKSALANGGHVPSSDNTSGSHDGEMRKAEQGHKGRRHNFSRTENVTIESCKPCHLPNASDFGNGHGGGGGEITHPEAQLDYHAATTEHCYNCHYNGTEDAPGGGGSSCGDCHNILRTSGDHTDILDSMFDQGFCRYQMDKVCVGCHMPGPGYTYDFSVNRHFEVYTEPDTTIDTQQL